jgi:hypothetical protein
MTLAVACEGHEGLALTADSRATVRGHLIPALAARAHRGEAPWPKRLRIHKIGEVYSLTWSF